MSYCKHCGAELPAGAAFCTKCGLSQTATQEMTPAPPPGAPMTQNSPATHALSENVAGLLCYVFGWVTGLIFFLIDKRPFVRFHAAQSMVVFGGLLVLILLVGIVFGAPFMVVAGVAAPARLAVELIQLVGFVLWIVLMIKAYQGQRFHVPVLGDIAENIARKQAGA